MSGPLDLGGFAIPRGPWPAAFDRRRDGWSGGFDVALADGVTWEVPAPTMTMLVGDGELAAGLIRYAKSFGAIGLPAAEFHATCTVGEYLERVGWPALDAIRVLLHYGYDLTPEEAGDLTTFSGPVDDPFDLSAIIAASLAAGGVVAPVVMEFIPLRLALSPLAIAEDLGTERVPC